MKWAPSYFQKCTLWIFNQHLTTNIHSLAVILREFQNNKILSHIFSKHSFVYWGQCCKTATWSCGWLMKMFCLYEEIRSLWTTNIPNKIYNHYEEICSLWRATTSNEDLWSLWDVTISMKSIFESLSQGFTKYNLEVLVSRPLSRPFPHEIVIQFKEPNCYTSAAASFGEYDGYSDFRSIEWSPKHCPHLIKQ